MQNLSMAINDNRQYPQGNEQTINLLDEKTSHSKSVRNKAIIVPRVQSMQEYILKHHKKMILREINRQLAGGTLAEIAAMVGKKVVLRSTDCSFGEMCFWRHSSHQLLADVAICVYISVTETVQVYDLYCELWVDMRNGMSFTCGECGVLSDKPERKMWMLSSYLVPILCKDEVEQGAEDLLLRYCPQALTDIQEHDAYVLAARMGLRVERYPLYGKSKTFSMLFFCPGSITAEMQDDHGRNLNSPYTVDIPADTIVINSNAVHRDCCQLAIYHECLHYDWHYLFFRLQDMHNSDINTLKTKQIVIQDDKTPANPLTWMEWQARRGSFSLMMPLRMMKSLIASKWVNRYRCNEHAGQRFDRIARFIAREYDLPLFRVRARLIQMGYIAAKGALNYVNGRYIEPFAFSVGNDEGNTSFVIDRKSLFSIYLENKKFREQMHSGKYIYVDGHVCLNDKQYVYITDTGPQMTTWANAHVDRCCLRFNNIYETCGLADYRFDSMNSDESYNRHYMTFPQSNNSLSSEDRLAAMTQVLNELPLSFHEALIYLMKQAHMTIERLEEGAGISARTISRLRTEERRDYSLDQVIAICIALHLPPWLSREMIAKAGFLFRPIQQHRAYQLVLDCMFMDTLDDVQKFLVESGCNKLRLSSLE